jgi:uncharacterized protein
MSRAPTEPPTLARPLPFTPAAHGVRVRLRVTPRARTQRIDGLCEDAAGGVRLKVAVTAAPEDGRANASVVALLAREWHMPKSAFSIAAGAADRMKILDVAGNSDEIMSKLLVWSEAQGWCRG